MNRINELFPDLITKMNSTSLHPTFIGDISSNTRKQKYIMSVLNQLGELSAEEQQLGRIITSAEKLSAANGHIIYLLKDAEGNSGTGEAIGFLKVAKMRLFLYDDGQTLRDFEPLCVLDFYIKKTHQRRGLGKKLFDFMLQDQGTSADQLAVDGFSDTMKSFLAKNYHITRLIKQPNNFAVAPQFFSDLPTVSLQRPGAAPFSAGSPAGRYTARKPPSTMGNVLLGDADVQSLGEDGHRGQLLIPHPRQQASILRPPSLAEAVLNV